MIRNKLPALRALFYAAARLMVFSTILLSCAPGTAYAQLDKGKPHWTTPNEFIKRGTPTIIFGTAGLDESDAYIRTEARFIRDTLFPEAKLLPDTAVNMAAGPEGWPQNPIIFGGPHVNRVMRVLSDEMPFTLAANKLRIGELDLQGSGEYGLIVVVPASDTHPEFLLYGGTGTPGIGGINSVWHGSEPILVTDRFGRFASGTFQGDKARPTVFFPEQHPIRLEWDKTPGYPMGPDGQRGNAYLHYTQDVPHSKLRDEISDAVTAGASIVLKRLGITSPDDINFYLYTDSRTKQAVTNNAGNGHSSVMANTVHMVIIDPRMEGPIENLAAHEATHVYAYQKWGPPGSALVGEGLAVWVTGSYARQHLEDYARTLPNPPPAIALMGGGFSSLPENQSYPLAGLFVKAAIDTVGKDKFMRYLYPSSASNWKNACRRAGTTPEAIQEAFAALFSK